MATELSANELLKWDLSEVKKVKVLLNAPLKDPVKYKILDYEVSLRRSEAALIEVITTEEAENILPIETADVIVDEDIRMQEAADRSGKVINIALVGNPNCGKHRFSTSLRVRTST